MAESRSGFFVFLILGLMVTVGILLFFHTSWYLPLFVIVFSFLSLMRLIVLTTPFQGKGLKGLPQQILAGLGLEKQRYRESVMTRIFLFPATILFVAVGLIFLFLRFVLPAEDRALNIMLESFWQAQGGSEFTLYGLAASFNALHFSLLCGLGFMLAHSQALNEKFLRPSLFIGLSIIGFMLCFALYDLWFGAQSQPQETGFLLRAKGGYWLATLPYISALLVAAIPLQALLDGFFNLRYSALAMILIMVSMILADSVLPAGPLSAAIIFAGWVCAGLTTGPVLFETQTFYSAYQDLKKKAGFKA